RNKTEVRSCDRRGLIAGGVAVPKLDAGFEGMGAMRPAHRIRVCRQRTRVAEVALGSDYMVGEHGRSNIDRISVDHGHVLQGLLLHSRSLDCRIPVEFVDTVAIPKLV